MSDSGWYARARARVSGQPQPIAPYQQQPQSPAVHGVPSQYAYGQAPVQTPVQQVQEVVPETLEQQWTSKLVGAAKVGGQGSQTNREPCPQCGSNHYFTNLPLGKRGPAPAPHCYNCGFNGGMFEQGLQSSWA